MLHEPASRATAAECDTTTLALTEDPFADADDMSLADLKKAAAKKPAAKKKTAPKKKITKKKDSKNAKVRSALPQPRGVPPRRRRAADTRCGLGFEEEEDEGREEEDPGLEEENAAEEEGVHEQGCREQGPLPSALPLSPSLSSTLKRR